MILLILENFDPNNIEIDEKSLKNILIYYIVHLTIKNLKSFKINSAYPLNFIFVKVNGYFAVLLMRAKKKVKI